MTVAPARLNCVTTDNIETGQLKTVFRVTHVRSHNVSENVGLPATGRAWARAPQKLQIEIRLSSVVPLNGELISDLLNVRWFQPHGFADLTTMSILRAILGQRWIGRSAGDVKSGAAGALFLASSKDCSIHLFALWLRAFSENRGANPHQRRAFFHRNRKILGHAHRELRKIDVKLRLQAIAQLA